MNNDIVFVTSMNEEGFHKYGKRMLDSVAEKWREGSHLVCFYHDFDITKEDIPASDVIVYRDLTEVSDLLDFRKDFPNLNGRQKDKYDWKMDAQKWCHKVFAMSEIAFDLAARS